MPLIGPSVDRRTLTLVCRLARSETLRGLVCFTCAQVFTSVTSWERMHGPAPSREALDSKAAIRMCNVGETLLKLEGTDLSAFMRNCSLELFRKRYGQEDSPNGSPFASAPELAPDAGEWQRRLLIPSKGQEVSLLCCPEDARRGSRCRHSDVQLCAECSIPLCQRCEEACVSRWRGAPPMVLCNDNFWGYTTDILYRYQVRWIEAAIVNPIWTTMLVYYVEGDYGHLMNEEMGQQKYRTVVRGSCCSFHMPWEDILEELREKALDEDFKEIPRPQECLKYMW